MQSNGQSASAGGSGTERAPTEPSAVTAGFDLRPDDGSTQRRSNARKGIVALVAFALLGATAVAWDYLAGSDAERAAEALHDAKGSATQDAQGSGGTAGDADAFPEDGPAPPDATAPDAPASPASNASSAPSASQSSSTNSGLPILPPPSDTTSSSSSTSTTSTSSTSTSGLPLPLPLPTLPSLP